MFDAFQIESVGTIRTISGGKEKHRECVVKVSKELYLIDISNKGFDEVNSTTTTTINRNHTQTNTLQKSGYKKIDWK